MSVPCVAFAGRIEDSEPSDYPPGLTKAMRALSDASVLLREAVAATPERLAEAIATLLSNVKKA
ncbi:MAG: hypothetical protein MZW92_12330 [Comamonadaceae bacterium]|nr:hypothetical protein [Comamonadaceae bacterium]